MKLETINKYFTYDETSATCLKWKYRIRDKNKIGTDVVGYIQNKYLKTHINKMVLRHHHIVWILHNGNIKDGFVIDHIDGNTMNNKISNLRLCTIQENLLNRKVYSNNKTGYPGIKKSGNKYIARIQANKKAIHLGTFNTFEEAKEARIEAEKLYFGEFRRKNL